MTATVILFLFVYAAAMPAAPAQDSSALASFRAGVAAQQRGELEHAA